VLAAAVAALRRVTQAPHLPPVARAREHARGLRCHPVVDRRKSPERVLERHEAHAADGLRRQREMGTLTGQIERACERRHAVAVAPIDHVLGGPEHADRLPALAHVVELGTHHRRQDPSPPVRGQDTDGRHARCWDLRAGHGHPEGESAGPADSLAVLESRVQAFRGLDAREALDVLRLRSGAEIVEDRRQPGKLLLRTAGPYFESHGRLTWPSAPRLRRAPSRRTRE